MTYSWVTLSTDTHEIFPLVPRLPRTRKFTHPYFPIQFQQEKFLIKSQNRPVQVGEDLQDFSRISVDSQGGTLLVGSQLRERIMKIQETKRMPRAIEL